MACNVVPSFKLQHEPKFADLSRAQLSPIERVLAQKLWDALVFPDSPEEARTAQTQLVEAPPLVQQALINEIVGNIRANRQPGREDNPFSGIQNHLREKDR